MRKRDLTNRELIQRMGKLVLIIAVVYGGIAFLVMLFTGELWPSKSTPQEFVDEYDDKFAVYADFYFDEEENTFNLMMTEEQTLAEFEHFVLDPTISTDEYGWNVVVENYLELSEVARDDIGESFDFQILSPYNPDDVILLIQEEEIVLDFAQGLEKE